MGCAIIEVHSPGGIDMAQDRDNPAATRTSTAPSCAGHPAQNAPLQAPVERPPATATDAEVADFVARIKTLAPSTVAGRGRLIFAMDATMSREPTWDLALGLQGDMFKAVKDVGGLDVQLVYFRGVGECRASKWVSDPDNLARLMTTVRCVGGHTQICRVLGHVRAETEVKRVSAVVYVGDAMEEPVDDLCAKAGEVGLMGVPVFMFQEGNNASVERAYSEVARLTKGAWCRFDHGSARQLRELLSAVAVYAAGGRQALERLALSSDGAGARLLIERMR